MRPKNRTGSLRALWVAGLTLGCDGPGSKPAPPGVPDSTPAVAVAALGSDTLKLVQAEMRNVDFHFEDGLILRIARLNGELVPTGDTRPVTFDDKRSFLFRIRSAKVAIDTASLDVLLNRHVFGYPGSPLRNLRISTEGSDLIQRGSLKKGISISFKIHSTVSLTPEGWIRLHPQSVKALGINMRGLLKFFGAHLDGLIHLEDGHGARIEGDDFLLDPATMLPPPRVRGQVTALEVGPGMLTLTFGGAAPSPSAPEPNYMWFRRGILRFGKLTMADADLKIIDTDSKDPFDFFLDRYNDQLVAGRANNTPSYGLVVHMPDFNRVPRPAQPRRSLTQGGER